MTGAALVAYALELNRHVPSLGGLWRSDSADAGIRAMCDALTATYDQWHAKELAAELAKLPVSGTLDKCDFAAADLCPRNLAQTRWTTAAAKLEARICLDKAALGYTQNQIARACVDRLDNSIKADHAHFLAEQQRKCPATFAWREQSTGRCAGSCPGQVIVDTSCTARSRRSTTSAACWPWARPRRPPRATRPCATSSGRPAPGTRRAARAG
jgi:hypothetical protein